VISLDSLRAFRAFAEHLNFTKAAELLHISQPALHVKISELSRQLETPLYLRQGRRLVLTAKGHDLLAFAAEMQDRAIEFEREFRDREALPVVLAAGQGAYLYLLGPALRAFLQDQPNCPLKLLTKDRDGCVEAVAGGRAHLGVAVLDKSPSPLLVREVARVHPVLAFPAKHRLARKPRLQLSDLDGCTMIVPPPSRPQRVAISAALQAAGVQWQVGMETQGWELTLHFVSLGLGVAVVNSFCSLPRGVVSRPLDGLNEQVYSVFWRPGYLPKDAQALRDTILACR
jgi:LysR family transcriptional regulator, low CO2-responsive transcriptional regulator